MGITAREVAREAGVSTATVSRALRGLSNVDPATRDLVLKVAERLDYVLSPTASRLASGRTDSIAVITPSISRWYFATQLEGIERVMQEAQIDMLLHTVGDESLPGLGLADRRLRSRVDGVLVLGLPHTSPQVTALVNRGLPFVLVGSVLAGVSSVSIDDTLGGRLATQHLINLDHQRIGLIAGDPASNPFLPETNRKAGYVAALKDAGLPHDPRLTVPGYFARTGGEQAMNALLAAAEPPTAVFAMSDEMAFGALRALHAHGLAAGRDVSLIGFDGHEMANLLDLTTVRQPVAQLGELAAEDLVARLADPSLAAKQRVLPTTLEVRSSTGRRT